MGRLDGVFAVSVNYRQPLLAASCARQLSSAGLNASAIVVVDNDDTPESAGRLRELLPGCQVLSLGSNLGFASGCNRGVSLALDLGAEAVLLINPDTTFGPELVSNLVRGDDVSGACRSPEIFDSRAPSKGWFAGAWKGRVPGTYRWRAPGDPRRDVDFLWACCLLIGRDAWLRVGPFDERYFLYYEDMDWCRRARGSGVQPHIAADARVWHAVGASFGGRGEPLRRYHLTRSSVLYHESTTSDKTIASRLIRGASLARTAIRLAMHCDRSGLLAHVRGIGDGFRLARRSPVS